MNFRRLLIVTNRVPYPLHDGGALAMDAMIRGYQQEGLEVYVLAMNTVRHFVPSAKLATLYPQIAGFTAVPFDNRLKPMRLLKNLLFSTQPEHAERFYSTAFEQQLIRVIQDFEPEVVQLESLFLSGYLAAVKQCTKARLVLRLHNVEYQIWKRLASETKGPKAIYLHLLAKRMQRFEQQIWRQYDLLLAITKADAAVVESIDATLPVMVAPFGIALKPHDLETGPSFTKTYHVGAMDWLANIAAMDWLIADIWPTIRRLVPNATFDFAGRAMPERFQEQLPEGATCYGEVDDLPSFLQDKEVLLVPLRAGGGIRIKILEAMAAGKLVISTDVGMHGIQAQPGKHYLQANTPDGFAQALRWCNDHPAAANEMIVAAHTMVLQDYNLRAVTQAILQRIGKAR